LDCKIYAQCKIYGVRRLDCTIYAVRKIYGIYAVRRLDCTISTQSAKSTQCGGFTAKLAGVDEFVRFILVERT
jgi:hypothetical protein